jgi:phage-related protein
VAGVGAPLATAFVRVRPDTSGFGRDLKRQVARDSNAERVGKDLSKALDKGIDLKQFSGLAQKIRDIRTIASTTISPIKDFATQIAKMAVVAGAASAALVGGVGLAGGLLALVGALAQVAGAAPLAATGIIGLVGVMGTIKAATLGVGDAFGEVVSAQSTLAAGAKLTKADLAKLDESLKGLAPSARELVLTFADLFPALRTLQQSVQQRFFTGFAGDLRALAQRFMPDLSRAAVELAGTLNQTVRGAVKNLLNSTTQWNLASVLAVAQRSLAGFGPVLARIPALFVNIAAAAGPAFQGLAGDAARVLTRVIDRLQGALDSGALVAGIGRGIAALKNLGSIVGSVFSAIHSAVRAASAVVGGDLLGSISAVVKRFADFAKSASGQNTLRGIFAAALPVLHSLSGLLQLVGPQLASLAPVVLKLANAFILALRPVIPVAAGLAKVLGTALASVLPAVSKVAVALGGALTQAILILQPIIAPLADAIASLLSPTGLLGAALDAIAPILVPLTAALGRVVGILAGAFITVLHALAPLLPPLVKAVAGLAVAVADGLAQALTALAPHLPVLIGALTNLLVAFTPLIPAVAELLPPLIQMAAVVLPPLASILTRIAPIIIFTVGAFVTFQKAIYSLVGAVLGPLLRAMDGMVSGLSRAGAAVGRFAADMAGRISSGIGAAVGFFRGMPGRVNSALGPLGATIGGIASRAMSTFQAAVAAGFGGAAQFFREIPGRIRSAVGDLSGVLFDAGKAVIQGLINGVQRMLAPLGTVLGNVGSFIADHKGPLDYDRRLLIPHGRAVMAGLIGGIEAGRIDLGRALTGVTGQLAGAGSAFGPGAPAGSPAAGSLRDALDGATLYLRDPLGRVVAGQLAAAGARGSSR